MADVDTYLMIKPLAEKTYAALVNIVHESVSCALGRCGNSLVNGDMRTMDEDVSVVRKWMSPIPRDASPLADRICHRYEIPVDVLFCDAGARRWSYCLEGSGEKVEGLRLYQLFRLNVF